MPCVFIASVATPAGGVSLCGADGRGVLTERDTVRYRTIMVSFCAASRTRFRCRRLSWRSWLTGAGPDSMALRHFGGQVLIEAPQGAPSPTATRVVRGDVDHLRMIHRDWEADLHGMELRPDVAQLQQRVAAGVAPTAIAILSRSAYLSESHPTGAKPWQRSPVEVGPPGTGHSRPPDPRAMPGQPMIISRTRQARSDLDEDRPAA